MSLLCHVCIAEAAVKRDTVAHKVLPGSTFPLWKGNAATAEAAVKQVTVAHKVLSGHMLC